MKKLMFLFLAMVMLTAGTAGAAIQSAADFLAEVQRRVDAGLITAEEGLLLKFQYAFEPTRLPEDLQPDRFAPMKSGTPLVIEYQQMVDRMDPTIREAIENYLAPPEGGGRPNYYSPSGRFRLFYYTSGVDAVPLADNNGNLIPDFVENCADYLDYSLQRECTELGFTAPPWSPEIAYMAIYLEALNNVYGFTQPTGNPGMTRITMDNDFVGFPPNDDPDGDALGAAKVTAAHEFKHSSQWAGSNWSEGGWVEVDATWAEEIVYPLTNDYHNYLLSGSPISSPATPLDSYYDAQTQEYHGSYEDCVWQHWMSQTFGDQMIVDLWDWRRTHQSEKMIVSYETILGQYGSSIQDGWGTFVTWNFATGGRNIPGFGYAEASEYTAGSPQRQFSSYPNSYSGTVMRLAANWVRCLFLGTPNKRLEIVFDGDATARGYTLTALMQISAAHGGGFYFYELELDANNDGTFILPIDLETIYSVGIAIGNPNYNIPPQTPPPAQTYTIAVDKVDPPTAAPENVAPAFAITGNYPNPFNPSTHISFSVSTPGDYTLRIFDVQGRALRTVAAAGLDTGQHELVWDGRDDAGHSLPSGTYFARLTGAGDAAVHKLVLTK